MVTVSKIDSWWNGQLVGEAACGWVSQWEGQLMGGSDSGMVRLVAIMNKCKSLTSLSRCSGRLLSYLRPY